MTSLRQMRALAAMVVLAAMLLGRGLPTACADVLTFEDIRYGYDHIPNGYSGAEWFALDDFTYTRHDTHPEYAIWDDFGHGTTLGDLGYSVTAGNPSGLADIITDPRYAGNALMLMRDTATGDVSVEVAKNASLPLGGAAVEFDYRFLTTGKLNVLVGGVLMDTIAAPTIGDGSPGNTNNAHYSGTFDLVAAGLTPGDMDVAFELVHDGDPELHIDNVQVSAVVPEPMTVSLLAVGVLLLVRRRR